MLESLGAGHGRCRHRRPAGGSASATATAPATAATTDSLPPSPAYPRLALGERDHRVRYDHVGADDPQCPPAALLGAVWRELRPRLDQFRAAALPRLGDDSVELQPRRRANLAFRFRLGAGRGPHRIPADQPVEPPCAAAISRPLRDELAPKHVWQDIKDHARLHFPTGEAALRYNILQKISYVVGDLRPAPADDPDRAHHVAGDGRGLAVAARPLRRPAVGALDPLHRRRR